jgi:hypothetical protein
MPKCLWLQRRLASTSVSARMDAPRPPQHGPFCVLTTYVTFWEHRKWAGYHLTCYGSQGKVRHSHGWWRVMAQFKWNGLDKMTIQKLVVVFIRHKNWIKPIETGRDYLANKHSFLWSVAKRFARVFPKEYNPALRSVTEIPTHTHTVCLIWLNLIPDREPFASSSFTYWHTFRCIDKTME